jgi:hypothetical protein
VDEGTGASSYVIESSAEAGPGASWVVESNAVVQALGSGEFEVSVDSSAAPTRFYRVSGEGGQGPIVIGFESFVFQVEEGSQAQPLILLSAPFWGVLHYSVAGTVEGGDYEELSGRVQVDGVTAVSISVRFTDNTVLSSLRQMRLTLEAGTGYSVGGGSAVATLTLEDNDARWQGSWLTEDAVLGFELRLTEADERKEAVLESDGAGLFAAGQYTVALESTADEFDAFTGPIPLDPGDNLLGLAGWQTLRLTALDGQPEQTVDPGEIRGLASLVTHYSNAPHLGTTNTGTFVLLKPPAAPQTNEVEYVPIP